MFLIDKQENPSHSEIQDACIKMDDAMENAMDVMTNLSEIYVRNKEKQLNNKVLLEMEKLDDEFSATRTAARQYINAQKETSSDTSEILSVDLLNRMNISDQSEAYKKEEHSVSQEVGTVDSYSNVCNSVSVVNTENETNISAERQKNVTVHGVQPQQTQVREIDMSLPREQRQGLGSPVVGQTSMNAAATPFQQNASNSTTISIGQDLWRQLKRVQIPVFTGEKKNYQSWKASFLECIDSAPATAEYKLLQLRQYLSGDALKVIENLGHSATAYEAAKDRLERKFDGKRRQIGGVGGLSADTT